MNARLTQHSVLLPDRRRAFAWLGFIVLMLSLLAPQLSIESADAAQVITSRQEGCDEGFVLDERTGECEREPQRVPAQITTECPEGTARERETGACIPVTETAVPETETPVVTEEATEVPETETATAAETEPPAPVGYVQAIKRACPEGFVPDETTTITELQNTCLDPVEGVPFDILIGDVAHVSVPTDTDGLSQLGSAPVGEIALAEDIPPGFGEPIVYCAEDYAFAPFEHTYTEQDRQPVLDGNAIAWTLTADTLLQCFFYNIAADAGTPGDLTTQGQVEAGEGADVTVVKHRCPLGVPEDTTLDQYIAICTALFDGIDFTLDHAGGSFPGTTDEDGQVTWPNVPAGEIAIQEDIPAGYKDPLAFCTTFAGEQELASGQVTATGGTVPLTIPDEATSAVCWLFNLQDETLGSITIQKWTCPPGYEIDTMVEDPLDSCTDPGGGVTFTIDDGNPPSPDQTQVTGDDQGSVVFAGLEPGTHTVTEEVPAGIEQATGWCASIGQVQALDNPPRLVIDLAEGEHWVCDWLNVPDDGQPEVNSITVAKWRCPLGIPVDDFDQGNFAVSCTDSHEGIEFTLESGAGSDPRSTDESGEVAWEDIPAGPFSIQEAIPAGYLDPYVYCTYTPGDENALAMQWGEEPLTGGLLELEMGETADHLDCHWYNVPDENAHSLTMHKWECPAGFDENVDDPETHCTTPLDGVTFTLGDMEAVSGDAGPGTALFTGIPNGEYGLTEVLPEGFERAFYGGCRVNGQGVLVAVGGGNVPSLEIGFGEEETEHWECDWYNVPEEAEENAVEIHKWQCPEGTGPDQPVEWYEANCVQQHDGVWFAVDDGNGILSKPTIGGVVQFPDLPAGTVGIQEAIPDGFGPPMVFCGIEGDPQHYPTPTGHWQHDFPNDGLSETLVCWVFNIPGAPPSITITKWTCPPGYDLNAADADPKADCTEAANGVDFQFGPSGGAVAELQTTGDEIDGGVVFDDLEPGVYKAVELVPEGIASVFVLECTGHIMGVLQPYPLSTGNVLDDIDLDAGEHLVCDWYNVPEVDGGTLAVIKHICATETFVSEIDCQISEDGATFDLLWWDGADWQVVGTDTTDGFGLIVWTGLDSGDYWLDEHDGEWCHIAAYPPGDEDSFAVDAGEETVVNVYNCDPDWTTTTIPEKYPNTGAPPAADQTPGSPARLPAAHLLTGLLAISLTRRRLAALAAAGLGAAPIRALAQAGGTPVAEPDCPCLPATPIAGGEAACERGPVPATLRIDAIGVDAPVEVLEAVGGVMQQPTDEVHVAWYKESARLGEIGNIWLAGHLNWWTTPVAVFSDLGLLGEGDEVVLLDSDGNAFAYAVAWVRQESNLEPPRDQVLGMTDHPAVTLITCSGAWNAEISEYDARTVVRAVQVDVQPADTTAGG